MKHAMLRMSIIGNILSKWKEFNRRNVFLIFMFWKNHPGYRVWNKLEMAKVKEEKSTLMLFLSKEKKKVAWSRIMSFEMENIFQYSKVKVTGHCDHEIKAQKIG